mmetsp:Transcript_6244/g.16100  ORF Transcript_6244/g.16100 Transcript_6244/m.16100 type:complete len:250 (+) Transcript_6244:5063-5812(+)
MQPPERAGANLAHIPHAHKLVARSHQHQGRRALAADGRHRPRAGAHPELGRPRLPDIPQAHLPVTPAAHQNGGRRCHDARRLKACAARVTVRRPLRRAAGPLDVPERDPPVAQAGRQHFRRRDELETRDVRLLRRGVPGHGAHDGCPGAHAGDHEALARSSSGHHPAMCVQRGHRLALLGYDEPRHLQVTGTGHHQCGSLFQLVGVAVPPKNAPGSPERVAMQTCTRASRQAALLQDFQRAVGPPPILS